MRIGILIPEFPSQTHAFFWREAAGLRDAGAKVSIASTRRPRAACRHEFAIEAARKTHYLWPPNWLWDTIALIRQPVSLCRAIRYVLGMQETALLRRVRYLPVLWAVARLKRWGQANGIDHIHVNSCADSAHVAAMSRIMGGPSYSLALHGDLPAYGRDHKSKMTPAAFVSVDTLPLQRQVMEQVGLGKDKLPVIWMGADIDLFTPLEEANAEPGPLHITTVARLCPGKGHVYVLQAVRYCLDHGVDVHYTIAGEGTHRSEIERLIEELDLKDRVSMLGTISNTENKDLLQRSDVIVLASVAVGEAAPVSVMEAMSCGKPVICSIIGGTSDMIADGVDGSLIQQRDQQALNERLMLLASRPDERDRLGRAARVKAVETFDYRQSALRLFDRITQAVRKP